MQTNKKVRGAVSIFLVIVLVPCIVFTSLFVDLGRVHMSKSMSTSASDLALNSLLTNYDADLNEWYGIVASCQSIDEFYEASAQLFLRTLSSQGLSDDEIVLLSDYYANATSNDKIYDLLQVECQTAPSKMITAVDGANLSNATLIKDQVVEFMKYRAPIEITTSLIERLQELNDEDGTLDNASETEENKELVDDKTDYYEAEGELLEAAYNTYLAIMDYKDVAPTNEKLIGYSDKLTGYKNAYSDIHKLMISNLYNTEGLTKYSRVTLSQDKYNSAYTEKSKDVYSRKEKKKGVEHYYIDGSKITSLLDSLENKIKDFKDSITDFVNAGESLMSNQPGTGKTQANEIQWWYQLNKAVGGGCTTSVKNAGDDMLKAYSKVLAISQCELGKEIPSDWEQRADSLKNQVSELCEKYLKSDVTDENDGYLKTVKMLEDVSSSNTENIKSSVLTVTVDGQTKTIDNALSYIKSQLTEIKDELQNYVDLLDIAIDGDGEVESLDSLLNLAKSYASALEKWSDTADEGDTGMKREDQKEIADITMVCQEINDESVRVLKTRLTNIRTQFNDIIKAINSMSYGSNSLESIGSYSNFKAAAKSQVSESGIKLTNGELGNYASSTFSKLFLPSTERVHTLAHTSDAAYNPKIDPKSGDVSTPDLFIYLYQRFINADEDTVKEQKSALKSGKNDGNDKADAATSKGRYHGGGNDITKDFSGSKKFNIADGTLSAMIDFIQSLISLNITSIRDDLYVTSYIMNMCSYATYEEEGLYGLVEDKEELKLPSGDGYRPEEYDKYIGSADASGTWLSEDLEDSYNKSLTNKLINKTNNEAYEAEVEYILFGESNEENVKSVYNNIYGIRYVLNLVSGFKNFWSGSNSTANAIDTIAQTIQMLTQGIIPVPLTKVVLIPILTIFETSKDLDRLEAGFPVELFKNTDEEWWIKVPDGLSSVGDFTSQLKEGMFNGPNKDEGIFYSDYLTVFVYLGLKGQSGESMYQRLAEVIQTNMKKLNGDSTYTLKKSIMYFRLEAQIRVKPLMITLPFFNDYDNQMDTKTDWCTYTVNTVRGYS